MTFPDEFLWGATSSATQVEGASDHSDWYRWEQLGRAPKSETGNGFSTLFGEDFEMLSEHGLTNLLLTLDWARLEPTQGQIDHDAVEHYTAILQSARSLGVEIWACLHHFTLPGWFSDDLGGFVDEHARNYHWASHIDRTAEIFGDLVAGFVPIYEPLTFVNQGFLTGTFPPGRRNDNDFADALQATFLANNEAWRLLRSGDKPVMTIMGLSPVEPGVTSRHPDEREEACRIAAQLDRIIWDTWITALRDGILAVPGKAAIEVPEMGDSFNLIGFTYHDGISAYADGSTGPYPAEYPPGPTGDAPWPEGLGITLRRLSDALPGRSLSIAGCGVTTADKRIDDRDRVAYLDECIRITSEAIDDGVAVKGFFHNGFIDAYEWHLGYEVHSGLFDSFRNPRSSAALLANWATISK